LVVGFFGRLVSHILSLKGTVMSGDEATKTKLEAADSICPKCGPKCGPLVHSSCRLCGAMKTINSVSGNVIWMCNGRIVPGGAFQDDKNAYVQMAERYGIPKDQWPEKFRS
jgi:hypothetical protein